MMILLALLVGLGLLCGWCRYCWLLGYEQGRRDEYSDLKWQNKNNQPRKGTE